MNHQDYIERAIELALEAERIGNLPVGAIIVLDSQIVAEGASAIAVPEFDPGRHAETEALARVEGNLWTRAAGMTCYTTLEPCLMCYGSLLLHGVGRIVFGAIDPLGGASSILSHLPPFYSDGAIVPEWVGPVLPLQCNPLYLRAKRIFEELSSILSKS